MEMDQRFADLVGAFAALGISQHVLMAPDERHEARFAALSVPYAIQKFSGLFDLRTSRAAQKIADEYRPHIIQTHSPGSVAVAAKLGAGALRLGFADDPQENGGAALPCDLLLAVDYHRTGRKLDFDILPVPPLVCDPGNCEAAPRAAYDTPEGKPLIMAMADLDAGYDFAALLGAIREIPDVYFWIVGRGERRAALQEKARKQAVHDRVRFIEEDSDWPSLLRAADLCVVPRRETGTDRLTLQAWACGVCVISGMPPGRTPVTHKTDGLLVDGEDPLKWREAIRQILPDAGLRQTLATAGRQKYIKSYGPGQVIKNYLQSYETALRVKI